MIRLIKAKEVRRFPTGARRERRLRNDRRRVRRPPRYLPLRRAISMIVRARRWAVCVCVGGFFQSAFPFPPARARLEDVRRKDIASGVASRLQRRIVG